MKPMFYIPRSQRGEYKACILPHLKPLYVLVG